HGAAARAHQQKMAAKPFGAQGAIELGEIAPYHWLNIRINHYSTGAFVLAILAAKLVRERDEDVRAFLTQHLFHEQLMIRVHVAMQEAHRDRFDPQVTQLSP